MNDGIRIISVDFESNFWHTVCTRDSSNTTNVQTKEFVYNNARFKSFDIIECEKIPKYMTHRGNSNA